MIQVTSLDSGSLINFLRVVKNRLDGNSGKEPPPDPKNVFLSAVHVLSNDGDPTFFVWLVAIVGDPGYFLVLGCLYINFIWVMGMIEKAFGFSKRG